MRRLAPVIAALLVMFALAEEANAGIPDILRRGTRRMWVGGAFGPAFLVSYGGYATGYSCNQFKLKGTFGYHFKKMAEGPAIAVDLAPSFGCGYTALEVMPKFVWDIPIIDGLGLYLSPQAGIGFGTLFGSGQAEAGFAMQFNFLGKLMLGDRGYVFAQPFGLNFYIQEITIVRWDFLFGGGATF